MCREMMEHVGENLLFARETVVLLPVPPDIPELTWRFSIPLHVNLWGPL
jgi:hypothetical protein